jgi:hypothetical protein
MLAARGDDDEEAAGGRDRGVGAALVNDGNPTAVQALYDGANPGTPGSDNGYAVYLATQCTDAPWPASFSRYRTDNWRVYATAPFLTWSNAWFNAPCLSWPAMPGRPVRVSGAKVTAPMLLVSETLDPATPYSGALEVRSRFASSALIEGVGGTTHSGSLSGVACTDNAIARYLATGALPKRSPGRSSDLRCPPVPQPDPSPSGGSTSAQQVQPQQRDQDTPADARERLAPRLVAEALASAQPR